MHPAHRVLHLRPNQYMTPYHLKQVLQGHAITHGNGFGWIIRDASMEPMEIVPLMPNVTFLRWVGEEIWCETECQGSKQLIPYRDILHIRGASSDGLVGYLMAAIGKDTIGLGLSLKKFANKFFANGAKPAVVLEHPQQLDEAAAKRLRESWQNMYGGADNAGKTAVLEEGMKANFLTMSPEDSQALDSMKWNVTDVARIFRVPPNRLGDLERATFSNVTEANRQFLDDCLDPWLTVWEEECALKLLTEAQKRNDSHFVKFNTAKLLRMDLTARYASYQVGIASGVISPNEARDLEDLNPYEGGDTYQQTLNNAPVGGDVEPEPEPELEPEETPPERNTDAHRAVLVDALARMTKRLAVHANKAAKHPEQFCDWIDAGMADHARTLMDALTPAAALIDQPATILADELRLRAVQQLAELVEQTTPDDLATEVQRVTDTWQAFMPIDLTNHFIKSEAA